MDPDLHAPTQLHALQPVQDEQGSLDPSQLAQCRCQPILAGITTELSHQERRGGHTLLDSRGQAQDVVPVVANEFDAQRAANQGLQCIVSRFASSSLRDVELCFSQVSNTRREDEPE